MELQSIYHRLVHYITTKNINEILVLKDDILKEIIRNGGNYTKCISSDRTKGILRIAYNNTQPILKGYGICKKYKCVSDNFHAVMIYEDNIPLKLVSNDKDVYMKLGDDKCVYGIYPDFKKLIKFNKDKYNTINLNINEIMVHYRLYEMNEKDNIYYIDDNVIVDIVCLKNIIDVLGKDVKCYVRKDNTSKPIYFINEKNEMGIICPIKDTKNKKVGE